MPLNDNLKKEARKEFAQNYRKGEIVKIKKENEPSKQVEYLLLGGGSFGRKLLRRIAKSEMQKNKGQLMNPLGKMRSRQERKQIAKSLKMEFTPRYNGEAPVRVKQELVEVTNKKGIKYLKLQVVK